MWTGGGGVKNVIFFVDVINGWPLIGTVFSAGAHSFIQTISITPLQVQFYSEALPTQHGYCAGVSRRSATGNCELMTCPRSLPGAQSGSRTHDPPVESY